MPVEFDLQAIWYLSDGSNIAFITYTSFLEHPETQRELSEVSQIIRSDP